MPNITIKKIASELGYSRNTVAMAFKNDARVSVKTRKQIVQYALSQGYTKLPREFSDETSLGLTKRIMVLQRSKNSGYWDKVISGIAEEAQKHHCIINISVITQEMVDNLQMPQGYDEEIDAVFFLHKFGYEYCNKLLDNHIIGIFLDCKNFTYLEPILGDVIKSEGRRSVMELTLSLIDQGMKKIAYYCPYHINAETFCDRYEGYCAAMASRGLLIDSRYVITSSAYEDSEIAFSEALNQYPDIPEAIVCACDEAAMKVTMLLLGKGLQVPDDILITGFDNDEDKAFNPFFTTVDCNASILGKRMVEQFIWRMQHRDDPFEVITISSLPIYRKSSQKRDHLLER